ncbi:MAG: CoA-acylating methylmalonate-semialdehyde dehydrogenase [Chloroflexi bacterium]|nr:CoA-acylating methylmalonate-semialdehyde dehydrogenase [Chloroflexota bacterium]
MFGRLMHYINGEWVPSRARKVKEIFNPATGEFLAKVPFATRREVDEAVRAAAAAFPAWREVPPVVRTQYLFQMKAVLEREFDEIARIIVQEHGKTLKEAQGELRRGIENIEVATGIPTLMQGYYAEDVARGIDEYLIRQPLGVVAVITPFNFPAMIPLWFIPYALATGNTVVLKPSERTPITMTYIMQLFDEEVGLPPGVLNLIHGNGDAATALIDHPDVKAVSFVGSTPVARKVYARAAAQGKRVQAQGSAKNPLIIMPDAAVERTVQAVLDSVYGNAGQRCLAASLVITVGEAREIFVPRLVEAAQQRVVGYGLDEGVEMGPVNSAESKARIERLIEEGVKEGARLLLDGRGASVPGYEKGHWIRPTILDGVPEGGTIFTTEIFGPVMGLMHADTLDEAIRIANRIPYGNMANIFTRSGAAARTFRHRIEAGNVGINIGVAAPMAFFPFSGWKESFFGDLHAQDRHAVEFYTQTKVVVERWFD